jgi:phospholipase C
MRYRQMHYRHTSFPTLAILGLAGLMMLLSGCGGGAISSSSPPASVQLSVQAAGVGAGMISSNPTGINCGQACSASFASGAQVVLTASPMGNSFFAGWSGACSGTGVCSLTLMKNTSVMATFSASPVVAVTLGGTGKGSVASNPPGINCGPTCNASFNPGTQVILTASAATNSYFVGWAGGCSGNNPTCTLTLSASQQATATFDTIQNAPVLSVSLAGNGTGTISSNPSGINCGLTCSASFSAGTQVTLTEIPAAKTYFAGWAGPGCSGDSAICTLTLDASQQVTATFNISSDVTALNHIILMIQENRSLDHYFGAMRQYWASNDIPDQSFDGLAQFNPTSGAPPLQGPAPTNPGCDPGFPFPGSDCTVTDNSPMVASFPMVSMCVENPSPSWNEDHVDWNLADPVSATAKLNGFVYSAAHDARATQPPFSDTDGVRGMAYYDGDDLPFYYFMASSFGTSDRWFSPVMARSPANHMYALSGTSRGHVYGWGGLTNPTIFDLLQSAGITWKVYVTDLTYAVPPVNDSYLNEFAMAAKYPQNFVPVSQFLTDSQNGTLPSVSYIDAGYNSGRDEHPGLDDGAPGGSVQTGSHYVSTLIDGLMQSTSWQDSVFILTWDEFGGFYDHVPPQPTVSPDGIKPIDLLPGPPPNGPDICVKKSGPNCDFVYTGYRVPLIVISPFSKKNYVSHTVADYTAWLKLVETRFNLPSLTKRDAAQMDMTEFFDFTNVPWRIPPVPPTQPTGGQCYLNHLP